VLDKLLSKEVQEFIRNHEGDDPHALMLRQKTIAGVSSLQIAQQIIGRKKARYKLPTFYQTPGIIFPPSLNFEQSSSEETAQLKTEILPMPGGVAVDLTGGFGVDSFFLSKAFDKVHWVDPNELLLEIVSHNHRILGARNIEHHSTSAETFINSVEHCSLVFIDPSRRSEGKKIYTLADSVPNVLELQSDIFTKSIHLLLKASPLLDIKLALSQLHFVKTVYVVAVENEVKELLFLAQRDFKGEPNIVTINLVRSLRQQVEFLFSKEELITVAFGLPERFLYEPNAAILKAGAFKSIAAIFGLTKIHPSTHLYTSTKLIENFPGRVFEIETEVKPEKKLFFKLLPEKKANVLTRNYPLTPDELKKKIGLQDGGEKYVIGFTTQVDKRVVIASRRK
jgi:hypothetical protein